MGKPLIVRMFAGLLGPRQPILGAEIAGTVEAVGIGVTSIRPGDRVFGTAGKSGSFAEYASVRAAGVTRKPPNLTDEGAADATRYIGDGHAGGKVVLTIQPT